MVLSTNINRCHIVGILLACFIVQAPILHAEEAIPFDAVIKPLVDTYCAVCHNDENAKADLNLARFTSTAMAADSLGIWQRAAKRIADKEMPPSKAQQPSEEERARILEWIASLKPEDDCEKITSEESVSWYPGFVMSRRLNRVEYENTMRDLFGMELDLAQLFPADGAGGEGFDNNGNALFLSAIQVEKYLEAADLAVETALPSDRTPNVAGQRRLPGASVNAALTEKKQLYKAIRSRIITVEPNWQVTPEDAAREVLRGFIYQAWRRPVEPSELEALLGLFNQAYLRGDSYLDSLKLALKGTLVSPHFLFLAEPEPDLIGDYPLGDYTLASRLSYFIWASKPDNELMRLARLGHLQKDEVLREQLLRMLKDPKAAALGEHFASQWLGIVPLGQTIQPDKNRFPEIDDLLLSSMRRETEMFFTRIIQEDRPILELIDADYTFVDQRLAEIYGIEGVERAEDMQLVQLASADRGGVLGMAAVLTTTSHPLRTSPVLRGKWVLETLLGDRVPPPPPNVPALPEEEHSVDGLSMRQQLELHRQNPDCASCHNRMDPLGFGLENYDPIGRWRSEQAGHPIDSQGTLPNGEAFNGPKELKAILLARKDEFAVNLSRKLVGYALGRDITQYDNCIVERCLQTLQQNEYRPSHLFEEIVLSYPFRHRYSGGKIAEVAEDE